MNKNLRKKCLNALLLIAVFALTVWSVLHGEDLGELWEYLQMANDVWLIPAVGCVLAFIVGEAVVILYLMRTLGTRPSFGHCCLYSFIGFFYSCITPSASGGQPMQAIAMRRDGLPLPGGMGVSENLFLEMFLTVFGAELVLPGMVISRGISYYTQLLISAAMTLAASFVIRRREGSGEMQP